jgi:hypothetical protein
MRALNFICVLLVAALSLWALFTIVATIQHRADQEIKILAFLLLCAATPAALTVAVSTWRNRTKWSTWQILSSVVALALYLPAAILCATVNT